jgi:hypothetical protein
VSATVIAGVVVPEVASEERSSAHDEIVRIVQAERHSPHYEHQAGGLEGGGYWQKKNPLEGSVRLVYGTGWAARYAPYAFACAFWFGAIYVIIGLVFG